MLRAVLAASTLQTEKKMSFLSLNPRWVASGVVESSPSGHRAALLTFRRWIRTGYENVTAAAKAAAASALGINVLAWRAGQRPAFNQLPNGSIYTGQSCVLP